MVTRGKSDSQQRSGLVLGSALNQIPTSHTVTSGKSWASCPYFPHVTTATVGACKTADVGCCLGVGEVQTISDAPRLRPCVPAAG